MHEDPDLEHQERSERSPLLPHPKKVARSAMRHAGEGLDFFAERQLDSDEEAEDLRFDSPDEEEEEAYERSRSLHFGDYAYPNIDITREEARHSRWQQDDEIVHRRRRKYFEPFFSRPGITQTESLIMDEINYSLVYLRSFMDQIKSSISNTSWPPLLAISSSGSVRKSRLI